MPRDNFTEATIHKVAARVGYRCSYPGCPISTIGASMENKDKISKTGIGAHICAAAENGPRYDPNMTTEERRSANNCIWLCETHARLIDTDTKTYTVELLHKWKDDAEKRSAIALADISFFDKYYSSNGDNLLVIEELLNGLITDGSFDRVNTLLNQYKNNINDVYDELVLRYTVIYDVYCNRSNLSNDLKRYIKIPLKSGINKIVGLLFSFLLIDELNTVIQFCENEELTKLSTSLIKNEFFDKVIVPSAEHQTLSFSKEIFPTVQKALANYAFKEHLYNLKTENNDEFKPYDEEFYYEVLALIFSINRKITFNQHISSTEIEKIKLNIHKINLLDYNLQVDLVSCILRILMENSAEFSSLYSILPDSLKNNYQIQEIYYIYNIEYNIDAINFNDLELFSTANNLYFPLQFYLSKQPIDFELKYLNDHQFLFEKDSFFIYRQYTLTDNTSDKENIELINRYLEIHCNDFLFNCMKVLILDSKDNHKSSFKWLSENKRLIKVQDLPVYIDALHKYKKWDELCELSKITVNHSLLYKIGRHLHSSNVPKYVLKSKEIYLRLIDAGCVERGLFYNCGIIQYNKGEIDKAKKNLQKEFDMYGEDYSLIALLNMRYSTNDFQDDHYLNFAKTSLNAQLLNLAGAILEKLNKNDEALKYLLKSLLIDDNNLQCIRGLYFICSTASDNKNSLTNENTVCCITNVCDENETSNIAIHSPEVIKDITPNNFGDCTHCSSDDPDITELIFANEGDTVNILGKTYKVNTITTMNVFLSKLALSSIIESPDTIKFYGDSAEDAIISITEYMKKSSEESQKIIDDYNNSTIRYPLSIISKITGNSMLKTCEFLVYGNTQKIRNNANRLDINLLENVFVLSYESIVHIFLLGLSEKLLSKTKCVCTPAVYQRLLSDISDEVTDLTKESHSGTMVYQNGQIGIIELDKTSRKTRYQFLMRLKNFVSKISVCEAADLQISTKMLEDFFGEEKLYCEKSCLASTKSIEHSVLVTDDQFLYNIAEMEKLPTIGICSLFNAISDDISELLKNAKILQRHNFSSYFNLDSYYRCLNFIDSDNQDANNETLANFLYSDMEADTASEHHSKLVLDLYRSYISENPNRIKFRDAFQKIAIHHYGKLYPDEIKKIIHNTLKRLSITVDIKDEENGEDNSNA